MKKLTSKVGNIQMTSKEHNQVWWAGYNCQLPSARNPYILKPSMYGEEAEELTKEWQDGWECRFHGEEP